MKHIIYKKLLLLTIIIFFVITLCYPQESQLSYSANELKYNINKNEIILNEKASVNYKDMTLKADQISFFTEKKILIAKGNIDFNSKNNKFTGKTLLYNLDTKKAVLYNARAPIEKGEVSGKVILYEDEKYLYGKNSTFSTCKKINPHYSIKSTRMKVIKDNKIVISPVVFYIGHVPVFYLPSYFLPIPEKRKSGFLQPQISNNKVDGITYIQPFFLVLNRFSDLTYTFKYMTRRGIEQAAELRYKTHNGEGNIEGNYLYDNIQNRRRWQLKGSSSHFFKPIDLKLSLQANFFSDTSYFSDFGENIYDRTRNQASSYLVLEKSFGKKIYAKLKGSHFKSWINTEDGYQQNIRDTLPQLSVYLYSTQVIPNLYISGNSISENLYIDNSFKHISMENNFDLTYKHTFLKYFQFSENINNNFDYFNLQNDMIYRWVPEFNISNYIKIYGYFNLLNIGATDKVKHIITPRITYNYVPDMSQDKFIRNNIAKINEQSSIQYSLTNSFLTKIDESRKYTFLKLSTTTSQNLLESSNQFRNLSNSAEISPFLNDKMRLSLKILQNYDLYNNKTKSISSSLSYTINTEHFYSSMWLNYSKNFNTNSEISTFRSNTNLNITDKWRLSHNLLYDIKSNDIRNQSFGLSRDLHCWRINIEWENRENGIINYKFFIGLKAFKDLKWNYTQEIKTGKEQYDW
ncbi:MAG: LPS-assembly protein LptD [Candidatus Mcinerneyibacterium aminivorans]|uniref:LPS-assembly protein LptD n=1 Tax=Candidatus Mcinerneyibacterium aminivorans TaxID=2703815 RepID=A0A5D0MK64_9BACT|nr:MAG: LPS-assembly protein LptD [Candidatus Mcinerneyibacterium aminivorans]